MAQRSNRPQPAPKPFKILELEKDADYSINIRNNGSHACFDAQRYTGYGACLLRTLSPLHIGSGIFEIINGQVVKGFAMAKDQPVILGSSIKGVVRSVVEAISASCVSKGAEQRKLSKKVKPCSDLNALCPACAIFGSMDYLGRVRFADIEFPSKHLQICKIPGLWSPQERGRAYKDSSGKFRGRKFYYHGKLATGKEPLQTLPAGQEIQFSLSFENMSKDELCLLFTAMGVIGDLTLKLGGAKPLCLGSITFDIRSLTIRRFPADFMSYASTSEKLTGPALNNFLEDISKSNSFVLKKSLRELRDIWKFPNDRDCPSGLY